MGMAATSVLEPIVLLYRATGDERYLQFARYIVKSWDEPNGPKIVATLLTTKRVDKTANGKAYEMLSNLVGLCELARATGDRKFLQAVHQRLAGHRRQPALHHGHGEQFRAFPGRPRAAEHGGQEHRRDVRHHDLDPTQSAIAPLDGRGEVRRRIGAIALQSPGRGPASPRRRLVLLTRPLEGRKPYDKGITCCHSSGPRGMALAPQAAYLRGHDVARTWRRVCWCSTWKTSRATLELGGQKVTVEQQSEFPRRGHSTITLRTAGAATFAVKVRMPGLGGAGGGSGGRSEVQDRFGRLGRLAVSGLEQRRSDRHRFPSRPQADRRRTRQRRARGPRLGTVRAGLRPTE